MHDIGVRILSALLCSGVLLFVAVLIYSVLYPRKVHAAAAAGPAPITARAKDYGVLAPVARPLEWTIREVEEHLTRSWGWSIVATTFLVNLVLLPFRILAARNGQKLKALQPQLDAINSRYKAEKSGGLNMDPEHSRELSELYRANKTSALGSCVRLLPAVRCRLLGHRAALPIGVTLRAAVSTGLVMQCFAQSAMSRARLANKSPRR